MTAKLLLTFLGTTEYIPVPYTLEDSSAPSADELVVRQERGLSTKPRKFVQVALIELLAKAAQIEPPEHVLVFATQCAQNRNLEALQDEFQSAQLPTRAKVIPIPEGRDVSELWRIFACIAEALPPGGQTSVRMDVTHGFRSQPLVGLLTLQFLEQARNLRLDGIHYGAFESLGNFREVQQRVQNGEPVMDAPIFDLTSMHSAGSWARGASEWIRTGRPGGLIDLVRDPAAAMARRLQRDRPAELTGLPANLGLLADAFALVRHDETASRASTLVGQVQNASCQAAAVPELTPLPEVLAQLEKELSTVAEPSVQWDPPDFAYLGGQLRVARWYATKDRLLEAFSVLRELQASVAVHLANKLQIDLRDLTTERVRRDASYWLSEHSKRGRDAPALVPRRWQPFSSLTESLRDAVRVADESTRNERNKLDHCWLGEHTSEKFTNGSGKSMRDRLEAALRATETLLAQVKEAKVSATAPDAQAPAFVNLSNHSITTWSDDQRSAAEAFALGDAVELDGGLPLVDPNADTRSVIALATEIAQRAIAQGARGAHVAGEPVLCSHLVRLLTRAEVRCFAATTERQVSDRVEDEATTSARVFRFVRWREYSAGNGAADD